MVVTLYRLIANFAKVFYIVALNLKEESSCMFCKPAHTIYTGLSYPKYMLLRGEHTAFQR